MILVGLKGKATPRSSGFHTEGVLDLREVVPGCCVASLSLQLGLDQRLLHCRHWGKEPQVLFRLLAFSPQNRARLALGRGDPFPRAALTSLGVGDGESHEDHEAEGQQQVQQHQGSLRG